MLPEATQDFAQVSTIVAGETEPTSTGYSFTDVKTFTITINDVGASEVTYEV